MKLKIAWSQGSKGRRTSRWSRQHERGKERFALRPGFATGVYATGINLGSAVSASLAVPIAHAFGWRLDDWEKLGRATAIGHLLECAGQVTGGYFAEPGLKDVPNLAQLGFPWCDVDGEGNGVLGKVAGTGGAITLRTAKEQLLYEVTDPGGYITPDVVADFSTVSLRETGPDRVAVSGARGRARTPTYKVSVGYRAGFVGEGEISYAGAKAVERARLGGEIVRERASQRLRPSTAALRGEAPGGSAHADQGARRAGRRRGRGTVDQRPGRGRRRAPLRAGAHRRGVFAARAHPCAPEGDAARRGP